MGLLFRGGAKQKARLCGPGFQVSFQGEFLYLFRHRGPACHKTHALAMRTMRLFLMQVATLTKHAAKLDTENGCKQAMSCVFVGFFKRHSGGRAS
jgi:hypothetical protein